MNQFIALAVAEKIAVLQTVNYLEERAKRGSGVHVPYFATLSSLLKGLTQ